jgi:hypothetical protein
MAHLLWLIWVKIPTRLAVYGALADISYGIEAIPQRWVDSMKNADLIHEIAEKFAEKIAAASARG